VPASTRRADHYYYENFSWDTITSNEWEVTMKANSAAYVARPDILGTCVKLLEQNLKTKEQATH
jgi:hypothetical protein